MGLYEINKEIMQGCDPESLAYIRAKAENDAMDLLTSEQMDKKDDNEVRTVSSTGGEKNNNDIRMSLVPCGPLREVAKHYYVGSKKYSPHNWRKGYEFSHSYDAAQRHLLKFWEGESFDPDTQTHHLAAVIFHCMTLIENEQAHPEMDDRYKHEPTWGKSVLEDVLKATKEDYKRLKDVSDYSGIETYLTPSETDYNKTYFVKHRPTTHEWTCDCPAYIYSKPKQWCKHIVRVRHDLHR